MTPDRPELPADIALLLEHLRDALLARGGLVGVYLYGSLVTGDLAQAQVMPGAQGAGEQRRQGGGYSGLAQRQRRGKSALAA